VSGAPQDASALLRRARHLLGEWWRLAVSAARLAIGVPDYDTYVEHLRRHHPGREPMSYEDFFAERLAARYGKGRSRCCRSVHRKSAAGIAPAPPHEKGPHRGP